MVLFMSVRNKKSKVQNEVLVPEPSSNDFEYFLATRNSWNMEHWYIYVAIQTV